VGEEELRVTLAEELGGQQGGSLTTRLQDIVEEASRAFGRPIAIDDRHMRLLAHTEHPPEELDRVRFLSVMKRPFPAEVHEWLAAHGVGAAERPLVVPANAAIGLDTRVCAPIHCHGYLLGYLWLTDRQQTMTTADLERVGDFADEAGTVLYRELLLRDLDRSRERELLRDILSDDEAVRRHTLSQLPELDLFPSEGRAVVIVSPIATSSGAPSPENVRLSLDTAFARIRRRMAPKHGMHLVRADHGVLIASLADPALRVHGVAAFAAGVHAEIAGTVGAGERTVVAAGGIAHSLMDAATSYRQALRGAKVASTVSSFGDVVCWDDLGIYRMLTELPLDALGASVLHPGLRKLIEAPRSHFLVRTLESYLDHAGDSQATAASLFLHRTSLYHRLRRIEKIAGVDLRNGDDRLGLHLGLKLARLHGLTWMEAEADDEVQETPAG
jgi:hypothetical protein